jgi:hypothetical protein
MHAEAAAVTATAAAGKGQTKQQVLIGDKRTWPHVYAAVAGTREYMQAEVMSYVQQALEALAGRIQQERLKVSFQTLCSNCVASLTGNLWNLVTVSECQDKQ